MFRVEKSRSDSFCLAGVGGRKDNDDDADADADNQTRLDWVLDMNRL